MQDNLYSAVCDCYSLSRHADFTVVAAAVSGACYKKQRSFISKTDFVKTLRCVLVK